MKLNKIYNFTLESTKQVNLLNKLGQRLTSTETRKGYFISDSLVIKRNKNIVMIFLSKKKNGVIAYVCNYTYGVGEFMFYTHKELERINETWTLVVSKERILFGQWRMLWHKDSIINEFINPLDKAKKELKEAEQQRVIARQNLAESLKNVARAKEALEKTIKKFV